MSFVGRKCLSPFYEKYQGLIYHRKRDCDAK
ncbi:hypothetical protein PMI08_01752 [Brevibacillus sp. CF112]|nr:hypothetical protein PMI08_01752 [Brevibacillus sp. CF112]